MLVPILCSRGKPPVAALGSSLARLGRGLGALLQRAQTWGSIGSVCTQALCVATGPRRLWPGAAPVLFDKKLPDKLDPKLPVDLDISKVPALGGRESLKALRECDRPRAYAAAANS